MFGNSRDITITSNADPVHTSIAYITTVDCWQVLCWSCPCTKTKPNKKKVCHCQRCDMYEPKGSDYKPCRGQGGEPFCIYFEKNGVKKTGSRREKKAGAQQQNKSPKEQSTRVIHNYQLLSCYARIPSSSSGISINKHCFNFVITSPLFIVFK